MSADQTETHTHSRAKDLQLQANGITWRCIEKPTKKQFADLEAIYSLHPVHLKESTQTVQLTEVEREDNYIFLLVHVPTYDQVNDRIHTSQVGLFLGKDFVVTIHDGHHSAISELFQTCLNDENVAAEYCKQSAGYLLYSILRTLLEDVSGTIEKLLDDLDVIEGLVFDDNKSDAYPIGKLRQKIIRLKRIVGPLQSVLGDLAQQINGFSGENLSKYYSNNAKLTHKLAEVIAEAQETIEIFKDADFTTSTEQTNRILAVLTLVFTFTIPITVIGTLYGMNVPLPGGIEAGAWTFFGPFTTLGFVLAVSIGAVIGMYLYFKDKRWF